MTPTPQPHPVPRIPLTVNPADIGLVDALRAAGRYWLATPAHWVLPVVAVALVNLLAALVLGGAAITSEQLQAVLVNGPLGTQMDMERLPKVIAGPVAVGLVTLVARWFLVANAIAGLRGRELTAGWVVTSGLRAFLADMLVSLSMVILFSVALSLGPTGLLVILAVAPLAIYLGIRLQFWTLAIFDGRSVFGGADTSWRVTRRAVLRVAGWALAILGLGILVAIPLTIVDLVAGSVPVVGAVIGGTAEMALSAFTVVVMAILYESQRLRTDPAAYQASLAQHPAALAPEIPEPSSPYDPPPPPA